LPDCLDYWVLDYWVDESNPVRVVDPFVDALDLKQLGVDPARSAMQRVWEDRF